MDQTSTSRAFYTCPALRLTCLPQETSHAPHRQRIAAPGSFTAPELNTLPMRQAQSALRVRKRERCSRANIPKSQQTFWDCSCIPGRVTHRQKMRVRGLDCNIEGPF